MGQPHTKDRKQSTPVRRGVTAVEFALVAPLFFLFIVVSIDFGRLNVLRHTADNAAYEAARFAMVPGATADEARSKANEILNIVSTRGATIAIDPPTLGPDIGSITVTVNVPMDQNGWITPRFTAGSTIQGQVTLQAERTEQ